jgi:predicted MFS family arabinose efflux permease
LARRTEALPGRSHASGAFASFTVFWTVLSLHLRERVFGPFGLGPDVAGLFGIIGAVGILSAPIARRIADRHGPSFVVTSGAAFVLISWLVFVAWSSLVGLVVRVVILDLGVNCALVANQQQIFSLRPEARSRLNTIP